MICMRLACDLLDHRFRSTPTDWHPDDPSLLLQLFGSINGGLLIHGLPICDHNHNSVCVVSSVDQLSLGLTQSHRGQGSGCWPRQAIHCSLHRSHVGLVVRYPVDTALSLHVDCLSSWK